MEQRRELGGPDGQNLSILVVEDDADTSDAFQLYLTHLGGRVRLAKDGLEALQILVTEVPDVILCDLNMPRMSGRDFIRCLRRDPHLAHLVVIAVTGYDSSTNRERARVDGFDAYLTKPFDWETMAEALARARDPRSFASTDGPAMP